MATSTDWIARAEGTTIPKALTKGLVGWILAVWDAAITGTTGVFNLLILPLESLANVAQRGITAVLGEPLTIIEPGFEITAESLPGFGLLAGPASLVIFFGSMMIVIVYLRYEGTPDWLPTPGVPDLPTDWAGVEEDEK